MCLMQIFNPQGERRTTKIQQIEHLSGPMVWFGGQGDREKEEAFEQNTFVYIS